ncbi:MAG: 16S rRNA (cytosine(1402)-N(4))-methyltransferase RsmH [Bacteroidetes bacterium]|nr:16S rRNA (cytosine(1402)-N(4))-methyltransferase RsmH [Bacteroidota bacterium]
MSNYHVPVLLKESIEALNIKPQGIYVDATFGGGGHTAEMLKKGNKLKIFSFDQDTEALHEGSILQKKYTEQLILIHDNFKNLRTRLALERIRYIDGILFDLGVSSHQINEAQRGFSFSQEGKLDMRMNEEQEFTASDVVNDFSYEEIRNIIFEYGEEREAGRIARAILRERTNSRIETTLQLADIIEHNTNAKQKVKAKARVFQALRIFVNDEMESLKKALADSVKMLNPGGRIVVISYHSLEDRLVKKFFKYEEKDCICPVSFPKCICDKRSTLKIITRKPFLPSADEIERNNRARSAKLRIAEKREVV